MIVLVIVDHLVMRSAIVDDSLFFDIARFIQCVFLSCLHCVFWNCLPFMNIYF